jgi:hypothetical protein
MRFRLSVDAESVAGEAPMGGNRRQRLLTRHDANIKVRQPIPLMKSTNARSGAGTRRRPG